MSMFTEAIDRFVRWFFNSSPVATEIEPQNQGAGRFPAFVQKGMLGGAAVIALVLILVFYSVVAGAVDRAAKRHVATQVDAALTNNRAWHRPVVVATAQPSRAAAFTPRNVSYVRRAN